jgi:hypothetical protein
VAVIKAACNLLTVRGPWPIAAVFCILACRCIEYIMGTAVKLKHIMYTSVCQAGISFVCSFRILHRMRSSQLNNECRKVQETLGEYRTYIYIYIYLFIYLFKECTEVCVRIVIAILIYHRHKPIDSIDLSGS